MPPLATWEVLAFFTVWLAEGLLLRQHAPSLGSAPGDRSRDPLVNAARIRLGLGALWLGQACAGVGLLLVHNTSPIRALFPPFLYELARLQLLPASPSAPILVAGLTASGAGWFLRFWAMRELGRLFTFEIGIRSEHVLIQSGPYRWLRHPSYTGFLLLVLGLALIGRSLGLWLFSVPATVAFLMFRIRAEERMLARHFGESYRAYASRTWRLLPGLL